jgi:exodeoxyribonuclease VII large subunit
MGLFPPSIYSVTDITHYLRALLESDEFLQDVWVAGEIANLSTPASGHVYFSLKDESATLRCVIWKMNAIRLQQTLQSGMAIEAHGSISLYEQGGQYQLYVDAVRMAGEGLLYQEFLRLKEKLAAEGLFAPERKRNLPPFPHKIGIVTSPTGAALQDMLNTLANRYPLAEVVLAPATVQGEQAPREIAIALQALNQREHPDVILLGRGGGSLEDLWAFNDEVVVRAVVDSASPVVTGIGHETDFTLADFAADLRAPTPTGAATLATPDVADLQGGLETVLQRFVHALQAALQFKRTVLVSLISRLEGLSPVRAIAEMRQNVDGLSERVVFSTRNMLALTRSHFEGLASRLRASNPKAILARGYSVVQKEDGEIVRSVHQTQVGDGLKVTLQEGGLDVDVRRKRPDGND